jgi:hypothetical protein
MVELELNIYVLGKLGRPTWAVNFSEFVGTTGVVAVSKMVPVKLLFWVLFVGDVQDVH